MAKELKPGEVLMLENTRFHKGEEKNDLDLAKQMAALAMCMSMMRLVLRIAPTPPPKALRASCPLSLAS